MKDAKGGDAGLKKKRVVLPEKSASGPILEESGLLEGKANGMAEHP